VRRNGYWRSWSFGGNKVFEFAAHYLAIGEGSRIRGSAARHPEPSERRLFRLSVYHLSPSKRTHRACPRSIAAATSRPPPRRRNSASSCAPSGVVSRSSSRDSGRGTRSSASKPNCDAPSARSRKLYAFWSPVLIRIETETDERRNTKPARSARHMATPGKDAREQD
jgi:hypothetical protein